MCGDCMEAPSLTRWLQAYGAGALPFRFPLYVTTVRMPAAQALQPHPRGAARDDAADVDLLPGGAAGWKGTADCLAGWFGQVVLKRDALNRHTHCAPACPAAMPTCAA